MWPPQFQGLDYPLGVKTGTGSSILRPSNQFCSHTMQIEVLPLRENEKIRSETVRMMPRNMR